MNPTPPTALPDRPPGPLAPPPKMGRPTKFCAEIVEQICAHIADGLPIQYSAALCGLSHETVCSWQRKQPAFRAAVEVARARGLAQRLQVIQEAARTDWRAAAWYAEHIFPESFAKSRIQVEAVGQLEVGFVIPQHTLNEIADARARREQKQLSETNGA